MHGTQTLQTQRLLLRRFTVADAEEMYASWATDPEVTRYLMWQPHRDIEETRAILRTWERDYENPATYLWAVTGPGGALMGSLGIGQPGFSGDVPAGSWQPGYCLARPFWGGGYTTEALVAAMAYFVADAGVNTLWCCHAVANPASGRVMQKAGFVYRHDGHYHKPTGEVIPARFFEYNAGA